MLLIFAHTILNRYSDMTKTMRRLLPFLFFGGMIAAIPNLSAQSSSYKYSNVDSYVREAQSYQRQAQNYRTQADSYKREAERYQREAAGYTRRGETDRAKDYIRRADNAIDKYRDYISRAERADQNAADYFRRAANTIEAR